MQREAKVGLLLLAAVTVFAGGVFLIGDKGNVFTLKSRYFVLFESVGGLAEGNPVQLNGVNVGKVDRVVLPEKIEEQLLTVWISIDRRYSDRVRVDSRARIKTLGLLGDKFIEISSGSIAAARIDSDGQILAAPTTDVDKLITSGEDVVANVAAISVSLRNVLSRMEAGEGVLGELTADSEAGKRAKEAIVEMVESIREISRQVETGDGVLPTLIKDRELAQTIYGVVARIDRVLAQAETGDGMLSTLLNDPETAESLRTSVENLHQMTEDLATLATEIRQSEGILIRLLADEEYGTRTAEDLEALLQNLRLITDRIEEADGTLGKLIEDPEVHDAVNDIIVGIDESRLLRWLVRNRQKAGIKKRYDEAQGSASSAAAATAPKEDPQSESSTTAAPTG